jgi:hypothetical protein
MFIDSSQLLDLHFSFAGGTACMAILLINHFYRLAATKVFGSPAGCMLTEASLEVGCDAGIESVVRTKNYIDLPIHLCFLLIPSRNQTITSLVSSVAPQSEPKAGAHQCAPTIDAIFVN